MTESALASKQRAAECAMSFVESGMVVGLGTGSTAVWAVKQLAELLQEGRLTQILGVATSVATAKEALRLGISLTTLDEHPILDLTFDGADEVDPGLNAIKGGGGALLREKIVAQASRREIILVDESKLSAKLGSKWCVPVEVVPFGWKSQALYIENLGAAVSLRNNRDRRPFLTDQQNYILDCRFGPIENADELAIRLKERTGIVEHGLFLNMITDLILVGEDSLCRWLTAKGETWM